MRVSEEGLDLIKQFEGYQSKPYLCPGGYWTIGWGHLIKKGEHFSDGISRYQAEELLKLDVSVAEAAVGRLIVVPLRQGQFDALVSFTFNLGAGALQRSTLRRHVNNELYWKAPDQFRRWVYAGGKKLKGLQRRREAEITLFIN